MARKYKIVKVTEEEREFMNKYKVCACNYCSYNDYIFCTFRGQCPAREGEYLEKINNIKQKSK